MKNQLGSYDSQHQNVLLHLQASQALAFLLLQKEDALQHHHHVLQSMGVYFGISSGGRK